jgi:hypothetical protein
MQSGAKRKRSSLLGLVAAVVLAAGLSVGGDAKAHYIPSYEAAASLINSNYGGTCGDGWWWSCLEKYSAGCYYGGDGVCREGAHSLQIEGSFTEMNQLAQARFCMGVYRMYHHEFAQTYWKTCG